MSDQVHVLFLSHYFPPEGNAPASRTFETCKRWVAAGHRVTVITCQPNCPNGILYTGYRNRLHQRETNSGIEVIRVWTFLAANRGKVKRIANYLSYMIAACIASLFVRPDVVIATSPQFFCGLAGSVVSWLKRLPFILEVRDIWPESITAVGAMKISFLVRQLQLLERLMYATATHIVTVGDGYKDRLLERGVPGAKVTVVTNGVDRHVFFRRDPDPSIRSRHGIDGQFLCAYVGTIGMACGLDVVLRAARILKQTGRSHIRFLLVGDGAVREVLERKARAEGLENVVFAGLRQKHEIPLYLAAADACLIHLRKMELFRSVLPSKMFEAAAMAKPIILGVEGSAASLLHRCGGGICVEPENESELVEAVAQLAERPGHAKVLGESAREFVLKHFDRDPLSRRYLNLVTGIVAAGRTPSPHRVPMSDGRGALDDTDDEQGLVDTL